MLQNLPLEDPEVVCSVRAFLQEVDSANDAHLETMWPVICDSVSFVNVLKIPRICQ